MAVSPGRRVTFLSENLQHLQMNSMVLFPVVPQVINISSIAALQAYPQGGAYSISKYAMEGFSVNLREELKTDLIKVSTINPGATMSDSWNGSGVDASRIMKGEDIAEIVWCLFRLSPQTVVEQVVMRPQLGDL